MYWNFLYDIGLRLERVKFPTITFSWKTDCLPAKSDGRKLKLFVAFAAAKRQSKSLHEQYKRQCSVSSSTNGWINEKLTLRWINKIVGKFAFSKRLLVWDCCESHMTEDVKICLKEINTESVIVPGGCTKYIQAAYLVWNKLFKERVTELYDEWLSNGVHEFTESGNIKAVPQMLLLDWILTSWKSLPKEMVTFCSRNVPYQSMTMVSKMIK